MTCLAQYLRGMLPVFVCAALSLAAEFQAWQDLEVIALDQRPEWSQVQVIPGQPDRIAVLNRSQARIECYAWHEEATPQVRRWSNDLPLPAHIRRAEWPLAQLPLSLICATVPGTEAPALLTLVDHPPRILIIDTDPVTGLRERARIDLAAGQPLPAPLLCHEDAESLLLLIACHNGVRVVRFTAQGHAVAWLHPSPPPTLRYWGLADGDGDGDQDLLVGDTDRQVSWMAWEDGQFAPPLTIAIEDIDQFISLDGPTGADFCHTVLNNDQLLRRYRLARGPEQPWGRVRSLVLPEGAPWCGLSVGAEPVVLVADNPANEFHCFRLKENGFHDGGRFPAPDGIETLVAVPAEPGLVLLKRSEGASLLATRWNGSRFTFPQAYAAVALPPADGDELLTLARDHQEIWWAIRRGDDLHIFQWPAKASTPRHSPWVGVGAKIESLRLLDADRLLAWERFAREPVLLERWPSGMVIRRPLPQLKDLDPASLHRFPDDRLARLNAGVWQWLDQSLDVVDQVQLGEGRRLEAYVEDGHGQAWALEAGDPQLVRLRPDDAAILRPHERYDVPATGRLTWHPTLGLVLAQNAALHLLGPGQPWEAQLVQQLDARSGRPPGARELSIHRLLQADLDGDGWPELLLADDLHHQLSAFRRDPAGSLVPLLSWPVFSDNTYPYGGRNDRDRVHEPRLVTGADLDGDAIQDLILLSHDRLLLYLARAQGALP